MKFISLIPLVYELSAGTRAATYRATSATLSTFVAKSWSVCGDTVQFVRALDR